MKYLLSLLILMPLFLCGQLVSTSYTSLSFEALAESYNPMIIDTNNGIQWLEGLTWQGVRDKARRENKYIFLDCFTTWCGPCKKMDEKVYSNDTVGDFFNPRFVSIKVQMDKTKNDNVFIQNWYKDAEEIRIKYHVDMFPCFIFLNPQGNIVLLKTGYRGVNDFVTLAQMAMKSGLVYEDPYSEYNRLIVDYKQGIKHYDSLPYMIKTAYKLDDIDLGKLLLEDHTNYAMGLDPGKRYTIENIRLWSTFMLRSDGPRFQFFYKDGDLIDKVMNEKGYAQAIVDRTIQSEIIDSFYKNQKGGEKMSNTGMHLTRVDGKIEPDYIEANWKGLEKMLRKKFSKEVSQRVTLNIKVKWYETHKNIYSYVKYTLMKYKKNPPNPDKEVFAINQFAWGAFLYITNKKLLNGVIFWTEKAIKKHPTLPPLIDTYANLLYKVGRTLDAIEWQERAVKLDSTDKAIVEALEKMKRREKTHIELGAIW